MIQVWPVSTSLRLLKILLPNGLKFDVRSSSNSNLYFCFFFFSYDVQCLHYNLIILDSCRVGPIRGEPSLSKIFSYPGLELKTSSLGRNPFHCTTSNDGQISSVTTEQYICCFFGNNLSSSLDFNLLKLSKL